MVKPHASGPRMVRERRNRAEILDRAEKQAVRRSTKVHRDVEGQRAVLELHPEEDERIPRHDPPTPPKGPALRGCLTRGLLVGLLLAVIALLAAPRSAAGPVIPTALRVDALAYDTRPERVRASGNLALQLSGAPRMQPDVRPVTPPRRRPPAAPRPSGEVGTALVGGFATWYDDPKQSGAFYAAAGPALRAALGPGWRHQLIEVQGPGRASVVVELVDFCACGPRHGIPTFLDLSSAAFASLAPLSAGIVSVSIEIANELPRTDTL